LIALFEQKYGVEHFLDLSYARFASTTTTRPTTAFIWRNYYLTD